MYIYIYIYTYIGSTPFVVCFPFHALALAAFIGSGVSPPRLPLSMEGKHKALIRRSYRDFFYTDSAKIAMFKRSKRGILKILSIGLSEIFASPISEVSESPILGVSESPIQGVSQSLIYGVSGSPI